MSLPNYTKLSILILLIMLLTACATTRGTIQPLQQATQSTLYKDTNLVLVSKKQSTVKVYPKEQTAYPDSDFDFIVTVRNQTDKNINFSPKNVRLTAAGKSLKVYSYTEIKQEAKARWRHASTLAELKHTFVALGNLGAATSDSVSEQHYHDSQVAQSRSERHRIEKESGDELRQLSTEMLQLNTIEPGQNYSGAVRVHLPDLEENNTPITLNLAVAFGSEEHHFKFLYQKTA